MAASSVPGGFEPTLVIVAGDVAVKQPATILQAEWAKIGVKLGSRPWTWGPSGSATAACRRRVWSNFAGSLVWTSDAVGGQPGVRLLRSGIGRELVLDQV